MTNSKPLRLTLTPDVCPANILSGYVRSHDHSLAVVSCEHDTKYTSTGLQGRV